MATVSPWRARFGSQQGRIRPVGWAAPLGDYVFCLGSDAAGVLARFCDGDFIAVEQACTFGAEDRLLHATIHVRAPAVTPAGVTWRLAVYLDGTDDAHRVYRRELDTREQDLFDVTVSAEAGADHTIRYALEMLGADPAPTTYLVELPAVYLDALVLEERTHPANDTQVVALNRIPEPDEQGVPLESSVVLELDDVGEIGGAGGAATDVWIDDVLALSGGVFQPGFDGPGSDIDGNFPLSTFGSRITIDPTTPFGPERLVWVRVVAPQVNPPDGPTTEILYSFTTADTVAPIVVAAIATDLDRVRVLFDEGVLQADSAGPRDALNPGNYVLVLVSGAPAITPNVVSVASITDLEVELVLDVEATPDAVYRVTVSAVQDVIGNAVAPPNDSATFLGYRCAAPAGRRFRVWDWMPRSNKRDDHTGELERWCAVHQELLDLLLCRVDRFIAEVVDPDTAGEVWLDLMLQDLGDPFGFDLTAIEKRRLLSVLVDIYRSKGTDPGIVNAVRFFLGLEIAIDVLWILPDESALGEAELGDVISDGTFILGSSDPDDIYCFRVLVPVSITDQQRRALTRIVRYMKRAGCCFSLVEPDPPPEIPDHVELGLSQLDLNFELH